MGIAAFSQGLSPVRRKSFGAVEKMPRPESWYDNRYWRLDGANSPSTGDWAHNANFDISEHLAVGNNADISTTRVVNVAEKFTTAVLDGRGLSVWVRNDVVFDTNKWLYALVFENLNNAAGTTFRNVGILGWVKNIGGGDITKALGTHGNVRNESTGDITAAVGAQGAIVNIGAGTIVSGRCFDEFTNVTAGEVTSLITYHAGSTNVSGTGTVGTRYQFYGASSTGAGTEYGFYQAGSQANFFESGSTFGDVIKSDTHNTDDIGLTGTRWKDAYLQGDLYAGGIVPVADDFWFFKSGGAYTGFYAVNDGNIQAYVGVSTDTSYTRYIHLEADPVQDITDLVTNAATLGITGQGLCKVSSDLYGHTIYPRGDNLEDLGKTTVRWKDIYLSGNITDDTNTLTVANAKTAYDHSQLTTGNPHSVVYSELPRTSHVTYVEVVQPAVDTIVAARTWQDETLNVGNLTLQIDYPRNVTVTITPAPLETVTGTVTVNGTDCDGATIQEVFTVNTAAITTYTGDKGFALITSIVTDNTGAPTFSVYSVGSGYKMAVGNYPFQATTDVYKVVVNSRDDASPTINATYGTIEPSGAAPVAAFNITIIYRPYK